MIENTNKYFFDIFNLLTLVLRGNAFMPTSINSKFCTTNNTVTTVRAKSSSMNVGYKNNLRNTDVFFCFSIVNKQT